MKGLAALAIILLFVGIIILGPVLTIWALNTLFNLGIPFTLKTWFATLLLGGALNGVKVKTQSK